MTIRNTKNGVTLIETVVYIALLSLMLGGVLVTTFQLLAGTDRTNSKTTVEEDGSFVLHKIDWALTGITGVPLLSGSICAKMLSTDKINVGLVVIKRDTIGNFIEMKEGSSEFLPITTDYASVTCLRFEIIGADPIGIVATASINGIDFATTKYLR